MSRLETIRETIQKFVDEHSPLIIVNTFNDNALLALKPDLELQDDHVLVKFESLNERGGNSVFVVEIQGLEEQAIYLENKEGNVLMLQTLSLQNYDHYIKPQYFDSPDFDKFEDLRSYVNSLI